MQQNMAVVVLLPNAAKGPPGASTGTDIGLAQEKRCSLSTPSVLTAVTNCWCISTDQTTRAFFAEAPSPSLCSPLILCRAQ